ncbi:hypothetical protein ACVW0J_006874 [Bradyrhizobium sp. i1.7.7]
MLDATLMNRLVSAAEMSPPVCTLAYRPGDAHDCSRVAIVPVDEDGLLNCEMRLVYQLSLSCRYSV